MRYPCIVYTRSEPKVFRADNARYIQLYGYDVTYIRSDPDDELVDKLSDWPYCSWERNFCTEGLDHDMFKLYF